MPRKYNRTPEIRLKQSIARKKWLEKTKPSSDYFKSCAEKSKQTQIKNGTRVGRPKGSGVKHGSNVPCPICGTPVYLTKRQIELNYRKCCSRSCLFKDPIYLQKLQEIDRSYTQTEEYRRKFLNPNTPQYKRYSYRVHKLTQKIYSQFKHIINPNNLPRTIAGVDGGHHLDHKISIYEGFHQGLPPEEIAKIENLQMLPWRENIRKGRKC